MRKIGAILFGLILIFIVQAGSVFAQITDNDALFAVIQRQLAGDPTTWSIRVPDKKNNNVFVAKKRRPQDIMRIEENARTTSNDFNTSSWYPGEILRRYVLFDPKMANTRALEDVIRQLTDDRFFQGNYILTTNETSELGKIKDLYDQVVSRITRYEEGRVGNNNTLVSCLRDSAGVCRHMATILEKSLEKAGVTSQQMISPEHHWVRVTLSDPAFEGITFDLDPTWYQQAIPLAPRNNSSMSIEWSNRMLAITSLPSGVLDLNGMWRTEKGKLVELRHVGNGVAATIKESDDITWIGKVSFTGTLEGNSLTGTALFRAEKCPGLDRQSPASGSVSADGNTILLNSTAKYYNPETCIYTGETTPDTYNLTRVQLSPSPR